MLGVLTMIKIVYRMNRQRVIMSHNCNSFDGIANFISIRHRNTKVVLIFVLFTEPSSVLISDINEYVLS